MSKEVEKSNLKVMELENELKQKQKKLEEVQSEMLKYTSKIGKIIEDQSFLEENITNRNIDSNDNIFEKKTYGFEIIPFETICTFLIIFALTIFNWMKAWWMKHNDEAQKNADIYYNITNGLQTTPKPKFFQSDKGVWAMEALKKEAAEDKQRNVKLEAQLQKINEARDQAVWAMEDLKKERAKDKQRIAELEAKLELQEEKRNSDIDKLTYQIKLLSDPVKAKEKLSKEGKNPIKAAEKGQLNHQSNEKVLLNSSMFTGRSECLEQENKLKEIMRKSGQLTIGGHVFNTHIDDLELLGDLGNGSWGHVVKMRHRHTGEVIAVKQMRCTGNSDETKRIIMDLDVILKSDCQQIVLCLGCFISNSDVWIAMELMATCFDKLLKQLKQPIPEEICGVVAVATVKALHYLKEHHGVIHRNVKPSNILLDASGRVKLCDFGISGHLVDSKAKTRSAGCVAYMAYMAPERIDPPNPNNPNYDMRADVWSLGITLVEIATGHFPYRDCKTDFEVLTKVLQDDPPLLPPNKFSRQFKSFVQDCLMKDPKDRPNYKKLLMHPFIKKFEHEEVDVGTWLFDLWVDLRGFGGV